MLPFVVIGGIVLTLALLGYFIIPSSGKRATEVISESNAGHS